MTTTTDTVPTGLAETAVAAESLAAPQADQVESLAEPLAEARGSLRRRFVVAFLFSLVVALAIGGGAIYAYDQQYQGRVLPGVRVGEVELGGLDREAARAMLAEAYAGFGRGRVIVTNTVATFTIDYAALGRRADVDAMLDDAFAAGRSAAPVEQAIAEARLALRGASLTPRVAFDAASLEDEIRRLTSRYVRAPASASVEGAEGGFVARPARWGRLGDANGLMRSIATSLADVAAPAEITIPLKLLPIAPAVDDVDAMIARVSAERMVAEVTLTDGKDNWKLDAATVQQWIGFGTAADGQYGPVVDEEAVATSLGGLAQEIDRKPTNAAFLVGQDGQIIGVTASREGRALDVAATADLVAAQLGARVAGLPEKPVTAALSVAAPNLTTAEAEKTAPLMQRVSTWRTWFPIGEKNSFGANIWIPAELIDGYVVGPGETFDFWRAVGPVTRAKGFGLGGAIINGRTEPQGALAGGICSCSTTLFNAALRAGYKMGARRNHYYYIDRYPVGLDATVFISASGSRQSMSWTNDTEYPVLIRGINTRSGGKGYVRFDLYSVPNGRTVDIGPATVRNVRPAWDSVQYTSAMRAGARKRVEYPVDGKDVWRTVTVYENGQILRQTRYYSHYARITGIVLVGRG